MKEVVILIIVILGVVAVFQSVSFEQERNLGVFKSSDNGQTWQALTINSGREVDASVIKIDPTDSDIVYLGTLASGLFKTYSQGKHWHKLTGDYLLNKARIYDVAISSQDGNQIFVACYQSKKSWLVFSQDQGETFQPLYSSIDSQEKFLSLGLDPVDPNTIYLGTSEGSLLFSADQGINWKVLKTFPDDLADIVINPSNANQIYVLTGSKTIYQSNNKGVDWQKLEQGIEGLDDVDRVNKLILNPSNPNELYIAADFGLYRSNNSGQSWEGVDITLPNNIAPIQSVAIDPQNSNHLIYGAASAVFSSQDKGDRWQIKSIDSDRRISIIEIDKNNPNLIYIGTVRK